MRPRCTCTSATTARRRSTSGSPTTSGIRTLRSTCRCGSAINLAMMRAGRDARPRLRLPDADPEPAAGAAGQSGGHSGPAGSVGRRRSDRNEKVARSVQCLAVAFHADGHGDGDKEHERPDFRARFRPTPLPLSRMPRTMRRKWVLGRQLPSHCAHTGMPRNGNMKPEIRIEGRKKKKRHLHRLQLVLGDRGERDAHRKVGRDEKQRRGHRPAAGCRPWARRRGSAPPPR